MVRVRSATAADSKAVAAIYAPYVSDTAISFELEPPNAREMAARISETLRSHPWLVAEQNGTILGYAYAARFRARPAYDPTAEVSVYVASNALGRGIGRALLRALTAELRTRGFTAIVAGTALPNEAMVSLLEGLGFGPVGVFQRVGFKLGEWHDVGWWQLRGRGDPASPP